jgi:hypothetical protein
MQNVGRFSKTEMCLFSWCCFLLTQKAELGTKMAILTHGKLMMGGSLRFFPKIALISSDFFSVLIFTYVDKH